jgi:hypothetical protein
MPRPEDERQQADEARCLEVVRETMRDEGIKQLDASVQNAVNQYCSRGAVAQALKSVRFVGTFDRCIQAIRDYVADSKAEGITLTREDLGKAEIVCRSGGDASEAVAALPGVPKQEPVSAKIVSFVASQYKIARGDSVTFSWETSNATSVAITELTPTGALGTNRIAVNLSGTHSISPEASASYVLAAAGAGKGRTVLSVPLRIRVSAPSQLRGRHTIQQKSNGRYLDAHEGSNDNSVVTRARQKNTSQVWILTPFGEDSYTIQQESTRRYMDAHEGSNDNSVVTRDWQNDASQGWIIKPL